jgi:hypothetical protein
MQFFFGIEWLQFLFLLINFFFFNFFLYFYLYDIFCFLYSKVEIKSFNLNFFKELNILARDLNPFLYTIGRSIADHLYKLVN